MRRMTKVLLSLTLSLSAGILVGGDSVKEIEAGDGARLNGAMDSRSLPGQAIGY